MGQPTPEDDQALADALSIIEATAAEGSLKAKANALVVIEGGKTKPPPKVKQTNLDKVGGRQQELVANALVATDTALPIMLKALKSGKVRFRSAEGLASAIARMALAQAEIAKMIDAAPLNYEDTEALERDLCAALDKFEGRGTSA